MNKLVFGVGVNDADYTVQPQINGKRVICPYYCTWRNMIARGYSTKLKTKNPTYLDCSVCEEWRVFSNFRAWMQTQDWVGKQLDKDILFIGNKVYSPDTCVFVDKRTNCFINKITQHKNNELTGACFEVTSGKFQSWCSDINGKYVWLGRFDTALDAHRAWKLFKHRVACELALHQSDFRVAAALRQRYL